MSEITNEVLAERLEGLVKLINEKFNTNETAHNSILEQTKKTNGTVINNSSRISKLEVWQNRIIGGLIVSNMVVLPVIIVILKNWVDSH